MNPLSLLTTGLLTPAGGGGSVDVATLLTAPTTGYDPGTVGNALDQLNLGIGGLVLPVMQGSVYTVTALQQRTVTLVQGDTPTLTFDFGADYQGWTATFGAKQNAADALYAMAPRVCTWLDAAVGQGSVLLTSADTALSGKLAAEVELTNGATTLTALRFSLVILPEIITAEV